MSERSVQEWLQEGRAKLAALMAQRDEIDANISLLRRIITPQIEKFTYGKLTHTLFEELKGGEVKTTKELVAVTGAKYYSVAQTLHNLSQGGKGVERVGPGRWRLNVPEASP